jgi:hypothetical protein
MEQGPAWLYEKAMRMTVDFQADLQSLIGLYDSRCGLFFPPQIARSRNGYCAYSERGEELPPCYPFAALITAAHAIFFVVFFIHDKLLAHSALFHISDDTAATGETPGRSRGFYRIKIV